MKTRILALLTCILVFIVSIQLGKAQDVALTPMDVKRFEILQRVAGNNNWSGAAYRNYLIGLFEGLLFYEGKDGSAKMFCLPTQFNAGTLTDVFSRLEGELKIAMRGAKSEDYVSLVFVRHLTHSFPC